MKIRLDDRIIECTKAQYIRAKTRDLRDFGYNDLTEREVMEEVERILAGKDVKGVIGQFIRDDIVKED